MRKLPKELLNILILGTASSDGSKQLKARVENGVRINVRNV
jgi:hypothetical protein